MAVSSLTRRPLAIVAPTGTAYSIPGKWKSEAYCAFPLTFSGPSTRWVSLPMGDVAMLPPGGDSAQRGRLQGMREAAPGQLDLEPVLALRPGAAQGRFRGAAEARGV